MQSADFTLHFRNWLAGGPNFIHNTFPFKIIDITCYSDVQVDMSQTKMEIVNLELFEHRTNSYQESVAIIHHTVEYETLRDRKKHLQNIFAFRFHILKTTLNKTL